MAEIITPEKAKALEVEDKLKKLSNSLESSYVDICYVLADVLKHRVWEYLSYATFGEFTEACLGFGQRKGYYCAKIAQTADKLGLTRDQLIAKRPSKVAEILSLDPDSFSKEINQLLDKSSELTLDEIKSAVKDLKRIEGVEPTEFRKYKLVKEDAVLVDQAVELARLNYGSTIGPDGETVNDISESKALALIAQAYLQDPNNSQE